MCMFPVKTPIVIITQILQLLMSYARSNDKRASKLADYPISGSDEVP
jgi:hypothetical protein